MKVIKYLPILAICCMATGCNSKKEAVLTSGIDLANLDTIALPGTSFYQYACGGWMKNHPLTPMWESEIAKLMDPQTE